MKIVEREDGTFDVTFGGVTRNMKRAEIALEFGNGYEANLGELFEDLGQALTDLHLIRCGEQEQH